MFIFKEDSVGDYVVCGLNADVYCFCDFPEFEEDAEALACHDQPGCVLGLVEEVLRQQSPGTYKEYNRLHNDVADNCTERDSGIVLLRSPMGDIIFECQKLESGLVMSTMDIQTMQNRYLY